LEFVSSGLEDPDNLAAKAVISLKPLTTRDQLEAWFLSSHLNPSPSSPIAALMRELLEKNPDLSFDQLRELARTGVGASHHVESPGNSA